MIPILIRIQRLQRRLLSEETKAVLATQWNWVDAYLQLEYGANSDTYLMLRQAMCSRCALILLDGIDEGGAARNEIESHITDVLAPQGHTMLITSRPAGVRENRFMTHFYRVELNPLTDAQQRQVVEQRLGAGTSNAKKLMEYLEKKVPRDAQTNLRVTGNPLMLSMVISIFESREGNDAGGMPSTIAELYDTASTAMLERVDRKQRSHASTALPHLTALIETTCFQAHTHQRRVIDDENLDAAALELTVPHVLEELRWPSYDGPPALGQVVKVLSGGAAGQNGVCVDTDGTSFVIDFNGYRSSMIHYSRLRASGLDPIEFNKTFGDEQRREAIHRECEHIPFYMRDALASVRQRLAADKLPLLSLLQAMPLQMQSSHLSFQEFFAVKAISRGRRFPDTATPPWQFTAWWANGLRLGGELGESFQRGLAASVGNAMELNLTKLLGGDRTGTSLTACAMLGVRTLILQNNQISEDEIKIAATAFGRNTTLTALDLSNNKIRDGAIFLFTELRQNKTIQRLDLSNNAISDIAKDSLEGSMRSNKRPPALQTLWGAIYMSEMEAS